MRVVIFGATGFIGRGVLCEALSATEVGSVVVVGRTSAGVSHEKLSEILVPDLGDISNATGDLQDLDACFWCLGVSSAGLDEETYTRITYTYTIDAARTLLASNPGLRFCFVSGAGADGNAMWARVKRKTEEELTRLGLSSVIVFRPAYVRDRHGAKMRGLMFKTAYAAATLLSPILRKLGGATSNAEIGQAMIVAVRDQLADATLSSADVNRVAAQFDQPER